MTPSPCPPGRPPASPFGPSASTPAAATSTPPKPTSFCRLSPTVTPLSPPPLSSPITPAKTTPSSSAPTSTFLPSFPITVAPSFSLLSPPSFLELCEAWKYDERALRYCNHDVGHALTTVALAAASLDWDARLLDGLGHNDLDLLLGLHPANPPPPSQLPVRPARGHFPWIESQHSDCALLLFPFCSASSVDYSVLRAALSHFRSMEWLRTPNLSARTMFAGTSSTAQPRL